MGLALEVFETFCRNGAALEARLEERREVVLKKGTMSLEDIAEISQLSPEEVCALARKRGA